MQAHQRGEQTLVGLRKAMQIGVAQHVFTVFVVRGMRDRQADLVQACRPSEQAAAFLAIQLPTGGDLGQGLARGVCDGLGMLGIDAEASAHGGHAVGAYVMIGQPAQQIVDQTFAQGAVGGAQAFDAE